MWEKKISLRDSSSLEMSNIVNWYWWCAMRKLGCVFQQLGRNSNLHLAWRTFDFTNNDKHNHLFWKYYKVGHLVAALGLLWLFHYVQIGIWQNFQIRWWKATLIPRPNVSPCSSVVYNISVPSFSLLFFWLIIHFSVLWEKSSTLGVLICRCCYFIFQSVLIIWIRGCEKIHS